MSAHPKQIIIIRHAEKPGDPTADDPADGTNLSTRGFERAAALAVYLPATFPRPDFLFATQASKHSNRPVETITPLSEALKLSIDSQFGDDDYQRLAARLLDDARYADKVVLICWHHGKIPHLTAALGARPPQDPWPGGTFDRVWSVDYSTGAAPGSLPVANLPQRLLFGDSST